MRILESLARVELTDGLTFPQLIIETSSRLPRDATVVAVIPAAPPETVAALATLKRGGYAVTALLLMPDESYLSDDLGRLIAAGIDFRSIQSEEDISYVCAMQGIR
jgi:hypothetical protein